MDVVAVGARLLLMIVFTVAAVGKLLDMPGSRRALVDFRVPAGLVNPVSWMLPTSELAVAFLLLVQPTAQLAGIAAAGLLALFMAGVAAAMARGEAPSCNCFGQVGSEPAGKKTLVRNGILGVVALVVAIHGAGTDPGSWFSNHTAAEAAVLVLTLLLVALTATVAAISTDRRSIRGKLDEATAALSLFPPGLPIGADAPDFALASTAGGMVSRDDLVARGRPLAVLFISPSCRPCHFMLPDVARWQRTLDDRLTIAVIAHGPLNEAQDIRDKFGLAEVLSDPEANAFRAYRGQGTPSVAMITAEGKVATRVRSSQGAVEAAIRRALEQAPARLDADPGQPSRALPNIEVTRWPGRDTQPA